jgi:hypothetical protein
MQAEGLILDSLEIDQDYAARSREVRWSDLVDREDAMSELNPTVTA